MKAILAGLAAIGAVTERGTNALVNTSLRMCEAVRAHRRAAISTAVVVLVLYLLAIGDIAVSVSGRLSTTPTLQTAADSLLRSRAPYLFEPILALRPDSHLTLFVSPVNILLSAAVAALAGANVAVARHSAQRAACHRTGLGRLASALPMFGLGFACCTPTLLVALGTSTGAALLPAMITVRPIFYPLTLVLLAATLIWSACPRKSKDTAGIDDRALIHDIGRD